MKIYIGADHRGYLLKDKIIKFLTKQGHCVVDVGTHDAKKKCDYPFIGFEVAKQVAKSKNTRGILICMSGIGQSITANKVPGAYAALCYNAEAAALSRQHNNSNIIVLSAKFIKKNEIEKIINVWLKTKFEGGRHLRRLKQIKKFEKQLKK